MDTIDFWLEPDKFLGEPGISDDFLAACLPSHYADKFHVSEYLVGVFEELIPKRLSVLELGSNCGRNLHYLREAGYAVQGIELNPATAEHNSWGVPTMYGPMEVYLPILKDWEYGVILTQSVLMHMPPEADGIYEQMGRVARRYIVINEVEDVTGHPGQPIKWSRNYGEIFTDLGWTEIYNNPRHRTKDISMTVTRVFKR